MSINVHYLEDPKMNMDSHGHIIHEKKDAMSSTISNLKMSINIHCRKNTKMDNIYGNL
jgi:hypothetical protein